MSSRPLRVAALGMGWWSDVLADAAKRSKDIEIVACFTRSEDKRRAFAAKYGCRAAASYEDILTTTRSRRSSTRRPTTCISRPPAWPPRPASTCSSTSRSPIRSPKATRSREICQQAGVMLALGYQRRRESHFRWIKTEIDAGRFGKLVQAEGNISRDRLGKIDLSSWRYQAAGMPGGVMLQIGLHYVDVLEMLLGPVARVSGMLGAARAAGRQSRRRRPHARARMRRDLELDRVLCVGVRVLHDERLRQGRECLLRLVLGPAASQTRRDQGAADCDRD